jgi:hypothetical protein
VIGPGCRRTAAPAGPCPTPVRLVQRPEPRIVVPENLVSGGCAGSPCATSYHQVARSMTSGSTAVNNSKTGS